MFRFVLFLVSSLLAFSTMLVLDDRLALAGESYAIAMHGTPALPADFTHMPYANPGAPKGGRLVQGVLGTFDSLNPLIVKGLAVQQIRGFVVESLMARGNDEAFTL
jgi:peptide/nickel transport system substrate-binding protein